MTRLIQHREDGFVLMTTYIMMAALLALLGAYYIITKIELATTRYSKDSTAGFYAAEAGLNIRAEEVRGIFVGYNRPSGVGPTDVDPCEGVNQGSGDLMCKSYTVNNRTVVTYLQEHAGNPVILSIPAGERYQNLNAQEYRYTVVSEARNVEGRTEAILELRFKSRLVPLFQFCAFYNKDLEIAPGPDMNLSGPIHTNGDLYLNGNNDLNISGQVTTAGDLYRGRKNNTSCSGDVSVIDPTNLLELVNNCGSRTLLATADVVDWNGMIQIDVDQVSVPQPEALEPGGGQYWSKADLRLRLELDGSNNPVTDAFSTTGVGVYDTDEVRDDVMTQALHGCTGQIGGLPIGYSNTFYNNREELDIRMLEVDMRGLLDCLYTTDWLGENKLLSDTSEGGLVFHFSVEGPDSDATSNDYGVRIRNAGELQSTDVAAPAVAGMTVVTDQAMYTHGDYNGTNKIPAAVLADSFNPLSNAWNLNDAASTQNTSNRVASNTVFNAAVLAGTDITGGVEGSGGQGGSYNGGLENYPRFHERWSGQTFSYRGSFVSLNAPTHVDGPWHYGNPDYEAPIRDWDYDTDFNDASNLPPITPRFVYLRQELFVREFEQ